MRAIKLALISFIALFFVVTIISLFFPSQVRISKAIQVNAPMEKLLVQISDPSNWKNWIPGADTMQVLFIEGKAEGLVLNAELPRLLRIIRRGEQEVQAEYKGIRQKKVLTGWNLFPESSSNSITVQWYMDFTLRWYPWEKFASILFEKQYGPQMEQGLSKLKKFAEN